MCNHYENLMLKLDQTQRKLRAAYANRLPGNEIYELSSQMNNIEEEIMYLKAKTANSEFHEEKNFAA